MPQTSDSRDFREMAESNIPGKKLVLAEGDSWFAYPRRYFFFGADANIIDHLADKPELIIYNSSSNGDEALAMLSGEQKVSLIKRLKHNEFDMLLFSGGGNDIVGKYDFDFYIQPETPGQGWQSCIRQDRVATMMGQIEGTYRTLCELVMEHSANQQIKIFTHTYEKLVPQEEGFELFDLIPMGKSWLYPYMMRKGIEERSDQIAIIGNILAQFKDALGRVSADYEYFKVVETWGLVEEHEWRNEIHPNPDGFKKIANRFYEAING